MKSIKIVLILLLIIPNIQTVSYAQGTELGTKDKKVVIEDKDTKNQGRKPINYENFVLTKDNIEWAKAEVANGKQRTETNFKNGKISENQYEARMSKIAKAERKIANFESNIANYTDQDDPSNEIVIDPNNTELINKKDAKDKRIKEKAERDRKEREAKKKSGRLKRYQETLVNIRAEKEKLKADKQSGKITEKDYNQQLARLNQSEKRLTELLDELKGSGGKTSTKAIPKDKDGKVQDTESIKIKIDNELNKSVSDAEKRISEAKQRIRKEKEQLERDFKDGKISQALYDEKRLRLQRVKKAIKDLEDKVEKGKKL